MSIRVIRVLEYTFTSLAAAEEHLANSFVPLNGVKTIGNKAKLMLVRSATMWPEQVKEGFGTLVTELTDVGLAEHLDPHPYAGTVED